VGLVDGVERTSGMAGGPKGINIRDTFRLPTCEKGNVLRAGRFGSRATVPTSRVTQEVRTGRGGNGPQSRP
jgi:hypothetical protein